MTKTKTKRKKFKGGTLADLILNGESGNGFSGGGDTGHLDFLKHIIPGSWPKPGSTDGSVGTLVDNVLSLAQTTINTVVDSIYMTEDLMVVGEELGTDFIKHI